MEIRSIARCAGRASLAYVLAALVAGCVQGAVVTPAPVTPPPLTIAAPSTLAVATATPIPTRTLAPPTPTAVVAPTATLTPAPLPSPVALALVVLPSGTGDGPPDLAGDIRSAPDSFEEDVHSSGKTLYRFADSLLLEVDITAIPAGARVNEVLLRFTSLDNLTDYDSRTERTPLYCAFGGGEPDCTPLRIANGARWPNSGEVLTNGVYCFSGRALLDSGATRTWRLLVEIASPDLPPDPTGGIAPVSGTVPPASPCLR